MVREVLAQYKAAVVVENQETAPVAAERGPRLNSAVGIFTYEVLRCFLNFHLQQVLSSEEALDGDALLAVFAAMQANISDVDIQLECCKILAGCTRCEKHRKIIHASDELFAEFLKSMNRNSNDAKIQTQALCFIYNLTLEGAPGDINDFYTLFGHLDLVESVLNAMSFHFDDKRVPYYGMLVLASISRFHDSHEVVLSNGGIRAILSAMKKSPSDVKLQFFGIVALKRLADNNTIIDALKKAGAWKQVEFAYQALEENGKTTEEISVCFSTNNYSWFERITRFVKILESRLSAQ